MDQDDWGEGEMVGLSDVAEEDVTLLKKTRAGWKVKSQVI